MVCGESWLALKSVVCPVRLALEIFRSARPLFVSVTVTGELVLFTFWSGKVTLVGEKVRIGTGLPVPIRTRDAGMDEELVAMLRIAVRSPVACGLKVNVTCALAPGSTVKEVLAACSR